MRNVTIKLSNLSIVLFLTKLGGILQFGTGQFGAKIVKMENLAPQFFWDHFHRKCQSRFICQTLKSNLFLHSCALQGTQTHLNLIFAQGVAENVKIYQMEYFISNCWQNKFNELSQIFWCQIVLQSIKSKGGQPVIPRHNQCSTSKQSKMASFTIMKNNY